MMRIRELHRWDVTPAEARAIQADLAPRIVLADALPLAAVTTVAGIDNAYVKTGGETVAHAVVVVLSFPELAVIETAFATRPVEFPYVPGLLSFRELPAVLAACAQIGTEPDAILCDGQGYAHPRRFGLACHLGLLLDRPTVGCAKSRLIGTFAEPERVFGAQTPLLAGDELLGAAVRTRPRHKPLIVSPGHQLSVAGAVGLVLACCRGAFLPEPTRLAHAAVTARARD